MGTTRFGHHVRERRNARILSPTAPAKRSVEVQGKSGKGIFNQVRGFTMKYKGFSAHIKYDPEDDILVGNVVGIRDGINFHGKSLTEIKKAFQSSVDDYLRACEELGQEPNRPYSGRVFLRMGADEHASIAAAAEASGKSINQWATTVLKNATE
jgi:predicted HicB family RNase H-like nuclease